MIIIKYEVITSFFLFLSTQQSHYHLLYFSFILFLYLSFFVLLHSIKMYSCPLVKSLVKFSIMLNIYELKKCSSTNVVYEKEKKRKTHVNFLL